MVSLPLAQVPSSATNPVIGWPMSLTEVSCHKLWRSLVSSPLCRLPGETTGSLLSYPKSPPLWCPNTLFFATPPPPTLPHLSEAKVLYVFLPQHMSRAAYRSSHHISQFANIPLKIKDYSHRMLIFQGNLSVFARLQWVTIYNGNFFTPFSAYGMG